MFDGCADDSHCATGKCIAGADATYCTQHCATENDCYSPLIGTAGDCIGPDGDKYCYKPCDKVTVETCGRCGCPNPHDYCAGGNQCFPQKDLFGACAHDGECLSDNCSHRNNAVETVCLVPQGEACSDDNCETCLGGVFCSRRCGGTSDPAKSTNCSAVDTSCITEDGEEYGYCYLDCGNDSPFQSICDPYGHECKPTSNDAGWFCEPV